MYCTWKNAIYIYWYKKTKVTWIFHFFYFNATRFGDNAIFTAFYKEGDKMNTKEELQIYIHSRNNPHLLNIMHIQHENPIFNKIRELRLHNQRTQLHHNIQAN